LPKLFHDTASSLQRAFCFAPRQALKFVVVSCSVTVRGLIKQFLLVFGSVHGRVIKERPAAPRPVKRHSLRPSSFDHLQVEYWTVAASSTPRICLSNPRATGVNSGPEEFGRSVSPARSRLFYPLPYISHQSARGLRKADGRSAEANRPISTWRWSKNSLASCGRFLSGRGAGGLSFDKLCPERSRKRRRNLFGFNPRLCRAGNDNDLSACPSTRKQKHVGDLRHVAVEQFWANDLSPETKRRARQEICPSHTKEETLSRSVPASCYRSVINAKIFEQRKRSRRFEAAGRVRRWSQGAEWGR